MNILAISDFFAELFADGGLYLCLLAAMGAVAVLFIIIALLVPKKSVKKDRKIEKEINQEKQAEEQKVEVKSETAEDVYDDEQVPTVKQVLGEDADEFDDGEPLIEAETLNIGRTDPILTFEQIISEAHEQPTDNAREKIPGADKPKSNVKKVKKVK